MLRTIVFALFVAAPAAARAFDHAHASWDGLLKKHVAAQAGGAATVLDYGGMAADRAALASYLAELSRVTAEEYAAWTKTQRMAFLINAYNAFTVELVLTKYPDVRSIKDLGGFLFFDTPWKKKFFRLLGRQASLDDVEHDMLRKRGNFDEPRVHFAVNCASVGCPALREEAYVAGRLDAQLEDQARRFLSDRSRNRFNPATGNLEVSAIFKWFKEDWSSGYVGIGGGVPVLSREAYFARFANLLADRPQDRLLVVDRRVSITFLDYDWSLNDSRRAPARP